MLSSSRVVHIWNSLPKHVVEAGNIIFEQRLNKYWYNKPIMYNFEEKIIIGAAHHLDSYTTVICEHLQRSESMCSYVNSHHRPNTITPPQCTTSIEHHKNKYTIRYPPLLHHCSKYRIYITWTVPHHHPGFVYMARCLISPLHHASPAPPTPLLPHYTNTARPPLHGHNNTRHGDTRMAGIKRDKGTHLLGHGCLFGGDTGGRNVKAPDTNSQYIGLSLYLLLFIYCSLSRKWENQRKNYYFVDFNVE